ncbi:hypothetical protein GALMADRAFT_1350315 [Galerina marginata CBS 339.88]|uniref:Uncharacterized protein n=1 Tax=Galerina marginata (strain CBS 339.88) TaxID=685588 RepID=A0A067SUM8_GALM3|nr:hypothetical protein GALMADRAFT_1350315 [Galerina marginata CBS 339.88]
MDCDVLPSLKCPDPILLDDELKAFVQYQRQTAAIIFSGLVYGCILMKCFYLISPFSKAMKSRWNRAEALLLALTLTMVLLSTFSVVQGIVFLESKALFISFPWVLLPEGLSMSELLLGLGIPIALPVMVWGANAIMESYFFIWRGYLLIRDLPRLTRSMLGICLSLAALGSLVSKNPVSKAQIPRIPVPLSAINIFLPIFAILLRFNERRRNLSDGAKQQRRINVVTIFSDSSIFIMLTSISHLVLSSFAPTWSVITIQILPQICVISPVLNLETTINARRRREPIPGRFPEDNRPVRAPVRRILERGIEAGVEMSGIRFRDN